MYYSAFVTMPKYTRHTENKVDLILCAEIPNGMAQSLPLWWMVNGGACREERSHVKSGSREHWLGPCSGFYNKYMVTTPKGPLKGFLILFKDKLQITYRPTSKAHFLKVGVSTFPPLSNTILGISLH
jgi:hypothetical protein